MPEILDRCVQHVMDKGYAESNAYAICRAQMGLKTDGSDDGAAVEMTEDEMKAKVETAIQFQNGPVLRKKMAILHPVGKFVNGPDQKGTMTAARIAGIVERFRKHPRQVPIFMLGDHPEDNDERMPVGWVEGLEQDRSGSLIAEVKLHGPGASAVGGDLIRGASVFTVQGRDYDGKAIGEVLKHLLLTNEPFDKLTNIAASHAQGGEKVVCFLTALKKETKMPAEKIEPTEEEKKAVETGKEPPEVVALKAENVRLQGEILSLTDKLDNATVDEEKHELALRVAKLERKTKAQEVREIVFKMLKEGTIDPSWCHGYAKGGDEGTLSWFKASRFKDNLELLKWAEENNRPMRTMGKTYQSGAPIDAEENAPTQENKDLIRSLGKDPDRVIAAMKAKDSAEFAALTAKKE